jgi:hypothetical protein
MNNQYRTHTKLYGAILLLLALYSSALAQDRVNSTNGSDYRFSLETNVGLVLSSGSRSAKPNWIENIIRSAAFDVEAGMRFPLSQTSTSLYIGLQGTSFSSKNEEIKYLAAVWDPTTGVIDNANFLSFIRSRFTLNSGIETYLTGSLVSRTTLGVGILATSQTYQYPNSPKIDDTGFTMMLRQSVMYEFERFMVGGKFEQTLSRYDNFSTIGFVVGIRF